MEHCFTRGFFLVLIIKVLLIPELKPSHIMGGDVEITEISEDKYRVQLNAQFDCRSTAFENPRNDKNGNVQSSDAGCEFSAPLNFELVASPEISPVCDSMPCTACDEGSNCFDLGFRNAQYVDTVDLSSVDNSCCNFEVKLTGACCRNSAIDNIESSALTSYNFSYQINTCMPEDLETPNYTADPATILCEDQEMNYNQGVTTAQDDSLAFSMVNPADVEDDDWQADYSADNPLEVDPSEGFNLDSTTGDLSFIPDSNMTAIMAIQVEQWRDDSLVSTTSREMQVETIDCDNEAPNFVNTSFDNDFCAHKKDTIPGTAQDPDSTVMTIDWNEAISGAQFDSDTSSTQVSSDFIWEPGENDVGSHNFTVEAVDNSCPINREVSKAINVDVHPLPETFVEGPDTVCSFSEATYGTTADPDWSYEWEVTNGSIIEDRGDTIEVHWQQDGLGYVVLIKTDNSTDANCSKTDTLEVYQKPGAEPDISGSEEVCELSPEHTFSTSFHSDHSYTWTAEEGNITSGQNTHQIRVSYANTEAGSDEITVTQTNDTTGCDSTDVIEVDINEKPAPEISGPSEVCAFTDQHTFSTDEVSDHSYEWNTEEGEITSGSNTHEITVSYQSTSASEDEISVTQTNDDTGCDSTDTYVVDIRENPTPELSGPSEVCEYSEPHSFQVDERDEHSYDWSIDEGEIIDGQNTHEIIVSYISTSEGSDELTLTKTNDNTGCDSTTVEDITINEKPGPEITGPSEVCEGTGPYTFSTALEDGHSYSWASEIGEITSGGNTEEVTISYINASEGDDEITVTQTDEATGCDSTVYHNVALESRPDPEISGPEEVCENTGERLYSVEGDRNFTYSWNINGGEILEGEQENRAAIDWQEPGTGNAAITVTDTSTQSDCQRAVSHEVDVLEAPQITIEEEAIGPFCYEETETLRGIEVTPEGGSGEWMGPGIIDDTVFSATEAGRGDHELAYIHALENGCSDTAETEVFVIEEPNPVQMFNVSVNDNFESVLVEWEPGSEDEFIDRYDILRFQPGEGREKLATVSGRENNTYTDAAIDLVDYEFNELCYHVVAENKCGEASQVSEPICPVVPRSFSDQMVNRVEWTPMEEWPAEIEHHAIGKMVDGEGMQIIAEIPGDSTGFKDELHGDISFESYCYYVETMGEDGRLSRSTLTCTQQPPVVFVPNSFSPGVSVDINETFGPKGMHIETYEMTIYDRWGQTVYETEEGEPWDGYIDSDDPANEGSYIYEMAVYGHDGTRVDLEGDLMLLR